jgi:hypothetical protein
MRSSHFRITLSPLQRALQWALCTLFGDTSPRDTMSSIPQEDMMQAFFDSWWMCILVPFGIVCAVMMVWAITFIIRVKKHIDKHFLDF